MVFQKLGSGYDYYVSSIHMIENNQQKLLKAVVIAWNDSEIRQVPVQWSNDAENK